MTIERRAQDGHTSRTDVHTVSTTNNKLIYNKQQGIYELCQVGIKYVEQSANIHVQCSESKSKSKRESIESPYHDTPEHVTANRH